MSPNPCAPKLLLFQPRPEAGAPLAFTLAEVSLDTGVQGVALDLFKDHLTASIIDVYDQDELLCTLVRPDIEGPAIETGRAVGAALAPQPDAVGAGATEKHLKALA